MLEKIYCSLLVTALNNVNKRDLIVKCNHIFQMLRKTNKTMKIIMLQRKINLQS